MSDSFQDRPRRNNRDWPQISFADGVTPLNRVYADDVTLSADTVNRFPAAETATRVTLTCQTVSAPTVGTITLIDGRLIKLDATGAYVAASSNEIVVAVAGLTAAQVATAIASAVVGNWTDLLAETDTTKVGIFTSKMVTAIASNSLTWAESTASLALMRPGLPPECIVGTFHPKCDWLRLVSCTLIGSTDKEATFQRRWQADFRRLGELNPSIDIEALLAVGGLRSVSRQQSGPPPRQFLPWVKTTTVRQAARTDEDPDTEDGVIQSDVSESNKAGGSKATVSQEWGTPFPLVVERFDPDTGRIRHVTTETVPAGTTGSGLNASTGTVETVSQSDDLWSVMTTEEAMGIAGDAVEGVASRTRRFRDNYPWPAVLSHIAVWSILSDPGDAFSSVKRYGWRPVWLQKAFNGPCLQTLVERWTSKQPIEGGDDDWRTGEAWVTSTVEDPVVYVASATSGVSSFVTHNGETYKCIVSHTPGVFATDLAAGKWRVSSPLLPVETPMFPQEIEFFGQELDGIQISECLHGVQWIRDSSAFATYPATIPARWPETILARVMLENVLGGWMTRLIYVDSPDTTGRSSGLDLTLIESASTSFKLSWTPGGGATKLDVSTDPTFESGFLTGYENLTVAATAPYEHNVTGARRGTIYYARVRRTAAALTSNTAVCMARPSAELSVLADDVVVATAGTIAFTNTVSGADTEVDLTLNNPGLLPLSITGAVLSGANADQWSLATVPASLIASASSDVVLTFSPTSAGAKTAILTITTNDLSSPYVINLTGTGTAPEINLKYSGTSYASGSNADITGVVAGTASDITVTIENTGTGNLNLGTTLISGDGWEIVTPPTTPVAGGGPTTCLIRCTQTVGGASVGLLTVPSDDVDEPSYTLSLVAEVEATPVITMLTPWGGVIASGGTLNMGRLATSARTLTVTIRNDGYADLTGLAVGGSGTGYSFGSIGGTGVVSLAPGATSTVAITFTTFSDGTHTGALTITSDDPVTPLFTLNLSIIDAAAATSQTQLEQPAGTLLTSGASSIDFGNVLVTGGTLAKTFVYRNLGATTSGTLAGPVSGTHSAEFVQAGLAASVVSSAASVGNDEFTVTFDPAGFGPRTATLTITDTSDSPSVDFAVTLTGVGIPADALLTGQAAAVIIGQADDDDQVAVGSSVVTVGPVVSAISSTGRLAIAEEQEGKVYIWNAVPTVTGTPADIVLIGSTTGVDGFQPSGVAWHGSNLWVSDALNHRVLKFTNPTTAGQNASLVLGQSGFSGVTANRGGSVAANTLSNPQRIIVSGRKLILCDKDNNRVLIWNTMPTANGQNASVAVGQANLTSNSSGTTATTLNAPRGVMVAAGKLVVADTGNHRVLQYSLIPTTSGASAAYAQGQANLTSGSANRGGAAAANTLSGPQDVTCHSSGVLAIADTGNNRVILFYSVPASNGSDAHAVLGQVNFTTTTGATSSASVMSAPSGLCFSGTDLLVSGSSMRRTMLFESA